MSRAHRATSAHSASPTPGPGIEVEHEAVGIPPRPVGREAPLRHVQLEARDLREVDEGGDVADERIVLRAARVRDRQPVHPVGGAALEVLREERRLGVLLGAHPVGPALAGHRPPGDVRDHRRSDAGVVVDHLALGRARLGVEHLVEVRDAQSPAADAHELLLLQHPLFARPRAAASAMPSSCRHHDGERAIRRLKRRYATPTSTTPVPTSTATRGRVTTRAVQPMSPSTCSARG